MYRITEGTDFAILSDKVVFSTPREYFSLSGEQIHILEEFLPRLTDGVSATNLADETQYSESTVCQVLNLLEKHRIIEEHLSQPEIDDCDEAHLRLVTDPQYASTAVEHLRNSTVTVAQPASLDLDVAPTQRSVFHDDIKYRDIDELLVSITMRHTPTYNRRHNKAGKEHGFDFLPVRIFPDRFLIGPHVVPGQTACFECAFRRQLSTSSSPEQVNEFEAGIDADRNTVPLPSHRRKLLVGAVMTEVKKVLTKYEKPTTRNSVHAFGFDTLESSSHHVLKTPNCDHN